MELGKEVLVEVLATIEVIDLRGFMKVVILANRARNKKISPEKYLGSTP